MLNQDQASEAWGRIKDFISNRNGDITHEERWGTRRLAYPIRKGSYQFLEGSYHLTRFSTEQSFNRELHTFLRLDEQVLRSLVVTTFAPGEEPKPPSPRIRRTEAPVPDRVPAAVAEAPARAQEAAAPATVTEPPAEASAATEAPAAVEEPAGETSAATDAPAAVEEPAGETSAATDAPAAVEEPTAETSAVTDAPAAVEEPAAAADEPVETSET